MIEVSNINFSYGSHQIFESFSVRFKGKITGLIGQNGAGKSTLVNLILALRRPIEGKITVDSMDVISERNEVLKRVGVMFERPDFPDWSTIGSHLEFVAKLRGLSEDIAGKEAEQLLKRFDLFSRKDSFFKTLSAGMKQKYAIAVAIIGYPKYVLLDEPTANLDVKARSDILEYLQELAFTKDMHILILSHILHDLERICDEVVFLHEGKIKGHYTMKELVNTWFIRDYSIKVEEEDEEKILDELKNVGVERIKQKGTLIEFRLRDKGQISKLNKYTLTPRRSLLEQIFVEIVGGEE